MTISPVRSPNTEAPAATAVAAVAEVVLEAVVEAVAVTATVAVAEVVLEAVAVVAVAKVVLEAVAQAEVVTRVILTQPRTRSQKSPPRKKQLPVMPKQSHLGHEVPAIQRLR